MPIQVSCTVHDLVIKAGAHLFPIAAFKLSITAYASSSSSAASNAWSNLEFSPHLKHSMLHTQRRSLKPLLSRLPCCPVLQAQQQPAKKRAKLGCKDCVCGYRNALHGAAGHVNICLCIRTLQGRLQSDVVRCFDQAWWQWLNDGAIETYCESAGSSMLGCLSLTAASAVNGLLLYLL